MKYHHWGSETLRVLHPLVSGDAIMAVTHARCLIFFCNNRRRDVSHFVSASINVALFPLFSLIFSFASISLIGILSPSSRISSLLRRYFSVPKYSCRNGSLCHSRRAFWQLGRVGPLLKTKKTKFLRRFWRPKRMTTCRRVKRLLKSAWSSLQQTLVRQCLRSQQSIFQELGYQMMAHRIWPINPTLSRSPQQIN